MTDRISETTETEGRRIAREAIESEGRAFEAWFRGDRALMLDHLRDAAKKATEAFTRLEAGRQRDNMARLIVRDWRWAGEHERCAFESERLTRTDIPEADKEIIARLSQYARERCRAVADRCHARRVARARRRRGQHRG